MAKNGTQEEAEFNFEKKPKHDEVFYAHVEGEQKEFIHAKAKEKGVSVSTLTNAVFKALREGKSVTL